MYRRCLSIQKIDLGRLDNLAKVVEHLRQTMEQEITGMSKDVNGLLQSTEVDYSEYYVRMFEKKVLMDDQHLKFINETIKDPDI